MKRVFGLNIIIIILLIILAASNCSEEETQINYETGLFPDEVLNIEGINSSYDDYNIALPQIAGELPIMFSSNRNSSGGNFDIVTGLIYFVFSQIDAEFTLNSNMLEEDFYNDLESRVNTDRNEFGPYRFFNGTNGKEYFFYSEEDETGKLNIKYTSYSPVFGSKSAPVDVPANVSALNGDSNDAYFCFDMSADYAYFCTDRDGDFDIVQARVNTAIDLDIWLEGEAAGIFTTDSINSSSDEKCPFIRQNIMIFASDRPGGLGGYDLYYSVYNNDKWSSPVNMGPDYNSEYNEYRPVLGSYPDYNNQFLMFSSDRPSGKGGYDLYFTGIDLELLIEED